VDRFEKGIPKGLPLSPRQVPERDALGVLHSYQANTLLRTLGWLDYYAWPRSVQKVNTGTRIALGTVGRTPRLLGTQAGSCDDRHYEEAGIGK